VHGVHHQTYIAHLMSLAACILNTQRVA
jgi:hypothetical protein